MERRSSGRMAVRGLVVLVVAISSGCSGAGDATASAADVARYDRMSWESIEAEWREWLVRQPDPVDGVRADTDSLAQVLAYWYQGGPCIHYARRLISGESVSC